MLGAPPPAALARVAVRGAESKGGTLLSRSGQKSCGARTGDASCNAGNGGAMPFPRGVSQARTYASHASHLSRAAVRHASQAAPPQPAASHLSSWKRLLAHVAPVFRTVAVAAPRTPPASPSAAVDAIRGAARHAAHLARNHAQTTASRHSLRLATAPCGFVPRGPALRPSMAHGPGLQTARNFSSSQKIFSDIVLNAPLALRAAGDEVDDWMSAWGKRPQRIDRKAVAASRGAGRKAAAAGVRRSGTLVHAKQQRRLVDALVADRTFGPVVRPLEGAAACAAARSPASVCSSSSLADDEASVTSASDVSSAWDVDDYFAPAQPPEPPWPSGPDDGVVTTLVLPVEPEPLQLAATSSVSDERLLPPEVLHAIARHHEMLHHHRLRILEPTLRLLDELGFVDHDALEPVQMHAGDGAATQPVLLVRFQGFRKHRVWELLAPLGWTRADYLAGLMQERDVSSLPISEAEPLTSSSSLPPPSEWEDAVPQPNRAAARATQELSFFELSTTGAADEDGSGVMLSAAERDTRPAQGAAAAGWESESSWGGESAALGSGSDVAPQPRAPARSPSSSFHCLSVCSSASSASALSASPQQLSFVSSMHASRRGRGTPGSIGFGSLALLSESGLESSEDDEALWDSRL